MKLYCLNFSQKLSVSITEAWDFFSNPANLPNITPPSLRITITSQISPKMYPGMIITYRIRPMPLLVTDWVTEITHVQEPYYFVDEQRLGPYRFWHHQHHFLEIEDGLEIRDTVHYALPYGPLGRIINRLVVHKQLHDIFSYRKVVLEDMFGNNTESRIRKK